MNRTLDRFFYLWALLVPITSVLVVRSIQGTVPAFLLSFLSFFVVIWAGRDGRARYMAVLSLCGLLWLFFFCASQLGDLMTEHVVPFGNVVLVQPLDHSFVLRMSLFTQSLYLASAVLYGVFVYVYYDASWDKALIVGAVLMASFGLYECAYFAITGGHGDFISNRSFGDELGKNVFQGFQTMQIAGHVFQRLKGLTGEPSMYAFSMFPYWVYARVACRSPWPARILGISLIMTASTTALLGLICVMAVRAMRMRINVVRLLLALLALAVLCYVFRDYIADFYHNGIINKIEGKNDSGQERFDYFMASLRYWAALPLFNQLIGVGFGYVRSTDMGSTLLVNNGILGVLLFSFLFLYPVFKLDWSERSIALRQCLLSVFVMMMVSVPEFSYLAPWAFVAMAYHRLRQTRATFVRQPVPLEARRDSGVRPFPQPRRSL